ncbi:hypothetical protein A5844_001460 [Enterococcus sp. 10A9_DIV0425]|uniref:LysM domain-containing protein n=1 Tax=Candidatus Enterococcus wittei TaxID=1987383 RepID=A0A242K172_9ENTE|nr:peptidoglycan-binding protein LysM [Enterococcus sp. 10A9_DIV0425]OTP11325.1 hypothetical protein A5844_001460 [Enterococcus sp. 10A9_DIV0425]
MYEENEQRENVRTARRRRQKQEARQRLMKIGAIVVVFLALIGGVTGLYIHGKNNTSAKPSTVTSETTTRTKESTTISSETEETQESSEASDTRTISEQLQAVVTDYSKRIEEKAPVLIEEYQAEIQHNQDGVSGLSAIANQKARELQAISDEGISKLRGMYQDSAANEKVDLDTLINQLAANYTEQVAKISDIYLRTSASLQSETVSSETVASSETSTTTEATSTVTSESQVAQETTQTTIESSTPMSQATTVVREGEGPTQIAERTGVPVEKILSLNGMTMDNFFFNPGEVVKLD